MVQKLKNNLDKKIFIKTFGCQMNEYDSNRIYDLAKSIDYEKTNELDKADCYVLNTCHIREKATDKVYHEIGRVKKNFRGRKKPIIVVTGCVAQAEGDILLDREKYIDAVIGPQSFHKFNQIIKKIEKKSLQENFTGFDVKEKFDTLNNYKNSDGNVSSFLTIQEGCDKFCKFCVVPYTRGAEFSRPINELVKECKDLVSNGVKEITLLGQNVNAYCYNEKKLSTLISKISEIKDIKRLRYTTSHPKDFTGDLIEVHRNNKKKLMPLIHLPVQSGSDKILMSMNRKHIVKDYLKIYEKLKKINSSIEFSSDFIIAYPGEEEEDFNATLELIKNIKFINSYSFIFSPRPGTIASKLKLIDKEISHRRLEKVQQELFDNQIFMNKSLENKEIDVLVENKINKSSKFFGRSEHMTSVIFDGNDKDVGNIIKVKINHSNRNTLFGQSLNISEKRVA